MNDSRRSGFRPAETVRLIGSAGAAHGAAPFAGVGAVPTSRASTPAAMPAARTIATGRAAATRRTTGISRSYYRPLRSRSSGAARNHTAKADVPGGGVDRLALPRSRPVAQAVVRGAKMRAALDHPARDVLPRPADGVARLRRR